MKNVSIVLILYLFLVPSLFAQSDSTSYSSQDRLSILYSYHFDEDMENWYFFSLPHLDIKYRMSNYKEGSLYSLVGEIGIQGMYVYMHFGPELKLLDVVFVNTTMGIYAGYIGIGLIGEAELGIKKNFYKKLSFECVGVYQAFFYGKNLGRFAPTIKIGIGFDL